MDDVLHEAERLAGAIAADDRTRELKQATAAVAADPEAKRLEEEYARATHELRDLEEGGRPIEPDLKRRVADLAGRIRGSSHLQRLLRAHARFAEMLDAVNGAISGAVEGALAGDAADDDGDAAAGGPEGGAAGGDDDGGAPPKSSGRILWTP